MSAAMESPVATDAAPGTTHAITDASAGGASGAELNGGPQAGAETAQADKGDYEARVRSDPDFALAELKKASSDRDRATGKLTAFEKRAGSLANLLTQDGAGDQVAALANAAITLSNHPEYGDVMNAAVNGVDIPSRKVVVEDEEDEYVDPEVKALREEMAALKANVTRSATTQAARQAQAEIASQFDSTFKSYDFTEEQKSDIFAKAESALSRMSAQQIESMNGNSWRIVLLAQADQETLDAAHERRLLRTQQERANLATDGPSSGANVQAERVLTGTPHEIALAALRESRERNG